MAENQGKRLLIAEELTNIRNLLIDIVSKIEKNYGLKQSNKKGGKKNV